jgi:hypothetical protein
VTTPVRARPLAPDDVPAVVALLSGGGGRPVTAEHYRWKLLERPSPTANVAIAVDERDHPVFHLAGVPCRCRLAGTERWVMVAVDAMTAPEFRRRGVLKTQARDLFARWKAAGIALVLGLPNENYRAGALGWTPMGRLQWLVLPLRPERVLARKLGMPSLARLERLGAWWRALAVPRAADPRIAIREVGTAGEDLDRLWQRAKESVTRSLARDRSWVAWRYLRAPEQAYGVLVASRAGEAVGYAACGAQGAERATIAEIFTAAGDMTAFTALVRAAAARALARGADSLWTLAAAGSWPHRALRRAGFFRSRHAFRVDYILLDSSLDARDVGQAADWYMVGGDFDAI